MLVKVFGAINLMNDLAQTLGSVRWRILQGTDTETLSEQMSLVKRSCNISLENIEMKYTAGGHTVFLELKSNP